MILDIFLLKIDTPIDMGFSCISQEILLRIIKSIPDKKDLMSLNMVNKHFNSILRYTPNYTNQFRAKFVIGKSFTKSAISQIELFLQRKSVNLEIKVILHKMIRDNSKNLRLWELLKPYITILDINLIKGHNITNDSFDKIFFNLTKLSSLSLEECTINVTNDFTPRPRTHFGSLKILNIRKTNIVNPRFFVFLDNFCPNLKELTNPNGDHYVFDKKYESFIIDSNVGPPDYLFSKFSIVSVQFTTFSRDDKKNAYNHKRLITVLRQQKNLKNLSISISATEFPRTFRKCRNLSTLESFSFNALVEGIQPGSMTRRLKNLKRLQIAYKGIRQDKAMNLDFGSSKNENLIELKVQEPVNLSLFSIHSLTYSYPNLKKMDIRFNCNDTSKLDVICYRLKRLEDMSVTVSFRDKDMPAGDFYGFQTLHNLQKINLIFGDGCNQDFENGLLAEKLIFNESVKTVKIYRAFNACMNGMWSFFRNNVHIEHLLLETPRLGNASMKILTDNLRNLKRLDISEVYEHNDGCLDYILTNSHLHTLLLNDEMFKRNRRKLLWYKKILGRETIGKKAKYPKLFAKRHYLQGNTGTGTHCH